MTHRVAVLFDNLGPYHIARLQAAASLFDLLAIEHRRASTEYAWDSTEQVPFSRVTLSDSKEGIRQKAMYFRLKQVLETFQPAAIAVPGWSSGLAIAAIRWALGARVPVVLMSASQEVDFERVYWKEAIKKRILSQCSAAIVGGKPHREYLRKLGMPKEKISVGYDVVDNEYFAAKSESVKSNPQAREQFNLPPQYFLCSARFIVKKNLPRLLHAYRHFLDTAGAQSYAHSGWNLVILGDGEQRAEVEALTQELGLAEQVHLVGFRQIDELPAFYALAGAFILPSTTEQWGLVVNEAMASGLPVLVSDRCGCASDLVEDGRNGFTFDPYDINALADLMGKIASDHCDRSAMGRASQEIISQWSPETFATGLQRAVEAALQTPQRGASILDKALLWAVSHR